MSNSPKGKLDLIVSKVNIIINGEDCISFNGREWEETVIQTVLTNTHHLPRGKKKKNDSMKIMHAQYVHA